MRPSLLDREYGLDLFRVNIMTHVLCLLGCAVPSSLAGCLHLFNTLQLQASKLEVELEVSRLQQQLEQSRREANQSLSNSFSTPAIPNSVSTPSANKRCRSQAPKVKSFAAKSKSGLIIPSSRSVSKVNQSSSHHSKSQACPTALVEQKFVI